MRDDFSTLDVCKALKIPRERLRSWMKEDFIKPTKAAQGQGTKAIFTRLDVYMIELFRLLLDTGFKRDVAAQHIFLISNTLRIGKDGELPAIAKDLAIIIYKYVRKYTQDRPIDHPPEPVEFIFDPITRWDSLDLEWGVTIRGLDFEDKSDIDLHWDHINVMNFKTLKQRVDKALAEVE